MSNTELPKKQANGIFYTPDQMASLLVSRASVKHNISILDPACGKGSLLRAAMERRKGSSDRPGPRLVGCDRFRPEELDHHIKFVHSDFFCLDPAERFNLILTNPPYIQAGKIRSADRSRYHATYAESLGLSRNLDLWAYFLLKSVLHLREGGTIAAILPWSFLEAEYAQKVRKWLADNFGKIEVLVLEGAHFNDTVKRVCLVWLRDYGSHAVDLEIAYSDTCSSDAAFRPLSPEVWNAKNALASADSQSEDIFKRLGAAGFRPLERYATVGIGIVTGANDYFIVPVKAAEKLGFSGNSVVPVLTSVDDLGQVAADEPTDKRLIQFKRMTPKRQAYVAHGLKLGLDQRSHCRRREGQSRAWYEVEAGRTPDAFFTYRVSTLPYLLLNPNGYRCTNALHAVSFNRTSKTKQKWIQLSVLSLFGQLSLEIGARHYGNGLIKVEPSALKKALVYASAVKVPSKGYALVMQCLSDGNKEQACWTATRLISKAIDAGDSLTNEMVTILNDLRARRGASLFEPGP